MTKWWEPHPEDEGTVTQHELWERMCRESNEAWHQQQAARNEAERRRKVYVEYRDKHSPIWRCIRWLDRAGRKWIDLVFWPAYATEDRHPMFSWVLGCIGWIALFLPVVALFPLWSAATS
jgi:hypothetical protein